MEVKEEGGEEVGATQRPRNDPMVPSQGPLGCLPPPLRLYPPLYLPPLLLLDPLSLPLGLPGSFSLLISTSTPSYCITLSLPSVSLSLPPSLYLLPCLLSLSPPCSLLSSSLFLSTSTPPPLSPNCSKFCLRRRNDLQNCIGPPQVCQD